MDVSELEKFIRKLPYPAHCIHCEGIDEKIERPKHHPSYEITAKCNLNCIFCYSKIAELKNKAPKPGYYGDLNPKAITISQFGEPFAAGEEKVARVIDKLREIFGDVRIDVQTNGTFELNVLDGRADIVMISLDASSEEKYYEITKGRTFRKVIENIRNASNFCYTVIRTVYMPGVNDDELRGIAEIAASVDELFLQPVSVYRENSELVEKLDIERAESIGDFIRAAYNISELADVRIPGCILLNIRTLMRDYELSDILLMRRSAFGSVPLIRREWRFEL